MSESSDDIGRRTTQYITTRGIRLESLLGFGREAKVFATDNQTALKVHDDPDAFQRELLTYLRLATHGIERVLGHHVPKLIDADDRLLALEITIVKRPFLLDFGAARLDSAPDFPPEVLETWEQEKIEQFGDHWPQVAAIMEWMRANAGIYLLDIHPGNIGFAK